MFLSVLSCGYGGGHRRVAETVAAEWRAQTGGRADVLDYFTRFANPAFDSLTRLGYYQAIRFAPGLQGRFYNYMGRIRPDSRFRRAVNRTGKGPLANYLAEARPDVVCGVHWTFAGTLSELKGAGRTAVPCLTVVTDFTAHGQWIHPHMEAYAVAHEVLGDELRRRGVPSERIIASGIPVERKFGRPPDRTGARARLGLAPDRPVVLVMAGAYAALGRVDDLVGVLEHFPTALQPVVVCANAAGLARRVRAAAARSSHPFRVLGYVDNVDELMAASDVLLTKAGGVTVSEALVSGLPMLLYGSIPGHEEANARFLVEHGAAVAARRPADVRTLLQGLLADPQRLAGMRQTAARLRRPDAAGVVVSSLAALAAGRPSAAPRRVPVPTADA
ncbi:MAG TPA: glycosyltransferase [bacterium]|nr:glycosyltransferase [bacterium]